MTSEPDINLWPSPEHALDYLRRADSIPHRVEGEASLLEFLPADTECILDLGSGGGRLLALAKAGRPRCRFVGLDFSPVMLEALQRLFGEDERVRIVAHDLNAALPPMGRFDAVISSFAIHHVSHQRKRSLYQEIFGILSQVECFAIWSTLRLRPLACIRGFSEQFLGTSKIRRTSFWMWIDSYNGFEESVSRT